MGSTRLCSEGRTRGDGTDRAQPNEGRGSQCCASSPWITESLRNHRILKESQNPQGWKNPQARQGHCLPSGTEQSRNPAPWAVGAVTLLLLSFHFPTHVLHKRGISRTVFFPQSHMPCVVIVWVQSCHENVQPMLI